MQERMIEKNRRKAFWGLQLKYTLAPVLCLYGIVFAGLTGMFLYNWFTDFAKRGIDIPLVNQLGALPLGIALFVSVIGVQVILGIGFAKQERNEFAMKRILLPREIKDMTRLNYSLLVTISAFLFYFLLICFLGITENLLAPEYAYGGTELFSVFYYYVHLYNIYPVVSVQTVPRFFVCIMAVSMIAPTLAISLKSIREYEEWGNIVWAMLICYLFAFYCFEASISSFSDVICLVVFCFVYGRKFFVAYRKRQEDAGEIAEVKSQC